MFTLYCDDSGTHPRSDIAVAACYVSTSAQRAHFERNWQEANEREQFGVFHMADFVGRYAQFASPDWQDTSKRNRTIRRLINIIKTRARIGFAAVVVKSAYDAVITNGPLKEKCGDNHYAFAFRICTAMVDRWRRRYSLTGKMEYVFDRVSEGRGDIDAMFRVLVRGGVDALSRYGIYKDCWSFQNKADVIPLQAADIWAYENYRYMVDCFVPGKLQGLRPKIPRRSYIALIDSPVQVKYHTKETLEDLVRRATELDE